MALVPVNLIDQPNALVVVWLNDKVAQDGAIGRVDVTARGGPITMRVLTDAAPVTVQVDAGATLTRTFAGASAKAGDVQGVEVS